MVDWEFVAYFVVDYVAKMENATNDDVFFDHDDTMAISTSNGFTNICFLSNKLIVSSNQIQDYLE